MSGFLVFMVMTCKNTHSDLLKNKIKRSLFSVILIQISLYCIMYSIITY